MFGPYTDIFDMPIVEYTPTRGKFRPLKRHAPPKGIKATVKRRRKMAKSSRQKNRR